MERAKQGLGRAGSCRWAAIGRSVHAEPAQAGAAAVRAALDGRDDARVVLLFASGVLDLDGIAEGAAAAAGSVPVVGCSTAVAADDADAVLALALGGDGLDVSTIAAPATDAREAGMRAAACLGDVAHRDHRLLLLFSDGLAHDQADVVRGAYSVTGAGVPLAGGIAAHPLGIDRGVLIHAGGVVRGAVVGVALGSDAPLGVGVAHSWDPVGAPMLVTRAQRGRILELDDRPARPTYLSRAGLGDEPSRDAVLAHPLARHGRDGPAHVRAVALDAAEDDGLTCALEAGALVSLMRARPGAALSAIDTAVEAALAPLAGEGAQALLAFCCAARGVVLAQEGLEPADERARLAGQAAGVPVAAVLTHGEFGRTRGISGFHHQSIVVVAVG